MNLEFKEKVIKDSGRAVEILTYIRDNMVGPRPYFYLCDCLMYISNCNIVDYELKSRDFNIGDDEFIEMQHLFDYYKNKFDANLWWSNYTDINDKYTLEAIEVKKQWLTKVIDDIKPKYV